MHHHRQIQVRRQMFHRESSYRLCPVPLVSPSIQSHAMHSADNESPSISVLSDIDANPSILSFPDHDTPVSQQSEQLVDDDQQLRLDAQVFVDEVIRVALEQYQQVGHRGMNSSTAVPFILLVDHRE